MKKALALVLALVFVLSMAAFAEADKTTVTIWHTFTKDQEAYLVKAAADFNALQDKYYVDVLSQAYSGFTDTVKTAVRSGNGPDIIFNYASEAAEYVDDGLVADLSQYIYADDEFAAAFDDCLPEGVMNGEVQGFADGLIHYLPAYTTGPILYYNKTLYDELGLTVPTTWEEMEANCAVIYEQKGIAGLGFDSLTDCLQAFIMEDENSTYINVEEKTVGFDTDSMKATVQWLVDCANKGYFKFKASGNYFSEDFNSGSVASYIGSCAGYPYITPDGFEFAMAPMPAQTWFPSWNRGPIVFYYKDDARAEGAYEFIKYFISAEVNLGWVKAVNALAPYSWTKELPEYQEYVSQDTAAIQALNAVGAHLDIAGSLPAVTGASTVRNEIKAAVENVAFNGMTVDEAWAACVANCNAALQGAK
ncbi:MAG: extracellular solute-binding protein [Clostridia bacterium]|nr:extracellular solute-binding protein [Clostridia bacterium]MBR5379888.1 extracellular solute-binding protein [Clostridia bacterium]